MNLPIDFLDQPLAITWAINHLRENGYELEGTFIPVRIMPWSQVYCITTSQGTIYLKQTTAVFSIEVGLLSYLTISFPQILPKLIGCNNNLHCLLMCDGGTPLRNFLQTTYQPELANKGLNIYCKLQQETSNKIDTLLALGVPDWRLKLLPSLYLKLLSEGTFLKNDGLKQIEIDNLKKLYSQVQELCHSLSQYSIPETIEHGDFHDNNMLLNNENTLIINDWGDTVITHPFFSMTSFLDSLSRNHNINADDPVAQNLTENYLNFWLKYESISNLKIAFELARRLNNIKFALSFFRIAQCPGMEDLGQYKGMIAKALIEFGQNERNQ
ncbi:phosphotransferase [Legionella dresdenensis]|uniref:Phosphotransferase n=1 Tax=Legionella dresdenensis TaxID=450200 RepID=A0ABV8CES9_9GAMM